MYAINYLKRKGVLVIMINSQIKIPSSWNDVLIEEINKTDPLFLCFGESRRRKKKRCLIIVSI